MRAPATSVTLADRKPPCATACIQCCWKPLLAIRRNTRQSCASCSRAWSADLHEPVAHEYPSRLEAEVALRDGSLLVSGTLTSELVTRRQRPISTGSSIRT